MEDSLKNKILSLRKEGKTYNEIKNILGCAKSTISYFCKEAKIENFNQYRSPDKNEIIKMQEFYDKHKSAAKTAKEFGWSKFTVLKYLKTDKRKKLTDEERKQKNIDASLYHRRLAKERLVEYKGGCCQICGYNKCIKALDFHHINPLDKEFTLTFMNRKWEVLKKEADKCLLVCSNCHREIHAGCIEI